MLQPASDRQVVEVNAGCSGRASTAARTDANAARCRYRGVSARGNYRDAIDFHANLIASHDKFDNRRITGDRRICRKSYYLE